MYLSHACVSFTYNWYYLHLIRVPFLPSPSLSLFLSSVLVTWFRCCCCCCCWDIPQVATRRGPTWPCASVLMSPDHVMWASSSASASWWSCWQSWGGRGFFRSSLVACRFSVSDFWVSRNRMGNCAFENLFVLHGVPTPVPPSVPHSHSPFPNNMHSLIMFIDIDCCHTLTLCSNTHTCTDSCTLIAISTRIYCIAKSFFNLLFYF